MLGEVQPPASHSALQGDARGSERNFGNSLGGRGRVAKAGSRCLEKGPKISLSSSSFLRLPELLHLGPAETIMANGPPEVIFYRLGTL